MSWMMNDELRVVIHWVENMMKSERLIRRVLESPGKVFPVLNIWYFYRPLRVIARWRHNKKDFVRARLSKQSGPVGPTESEREEHKRFALEFLHAVDTDGDGGLSLCELKACELHKAGTSDSRFKKASIWLLKQEGGQQTFTKYDTRGIGIIDEPQLIEAMEVFMRDHWKYDGVLW